MSKVAEFWNAFAAKDTDKLIQLIKENPALVNETQPTNKFSFLLHSLLGARPKELLECIVASPALNFNHEQKTDHTTTRKVLVESAQADLIALALNKPAFLFSDNELAYSLAIQAHKKFADSYEEKAKKDPNTPTAKDHKAKRDNLAVIIPMLHEATVKYATETKDQSLLKRLGEAEKGIFSKPVELNPNSLFAKKSTAEEIAEKELAELQKQLQQLRADHAQTQSELYKKIDEEHQAFITEAKTILRK
ncbi:hypothetical protein ACD661_08645 [Legionella lytica]|uniref:Substrate of the Dot/Icm secretion system n=1 Tax=Legionella lytica TaxID=96232 RepID=A0ABW8D7D9_9GAMM